MSEKIWYYVQDGIQKGPVEPNEIHAMLTTGILYRSSLIWREGMEEWQPLQDTSDWQTFLSSNNPAAYPVGSPACRHSGLATASLICGISSLALMGMCFGGILTGIPAVICGHMATRQIKNAYPPMTGYGLAVAGLILGYFCILITLAVILFIVLGLFGLSWLAL